MVKDAINCCKGLPLAISVISGINLRNDEDWRDHLKRITEKVLQMEQSYYIIMISIKLRKNLNLNQFYNQFENKNDKHTNHMKRVKSLKGRFNRGPLARFSSSSPRLNSWIEWYHKYLTY